MIKNDKFLMLSLNIIEDYYIQKCVSILIKKGKDAKPSIIQ